MDDKKEVFSFARAFSNEKGAFGSFLLCFIPGFFGLFCGDAIIHREVHKFGKYFIVFLGISAATSILYFIAKFLAYRTNIFPRLKRRERFHATAFFVLFFLTCAAYMAFMVLL